jgi:membrane-associated phospholipid phosphatase
MRRFPSLTVLFFFLLVSGPVFSQVQNEAAGGTVAADSPSTASRFRIKSFSHVFTESNDGFLPPGEDPQNRLGKPFLEHLVGDQARFWTSPKELTTGGAKTFIPFAGFTGLLIGADSWISKQVPDAPSQIKRSKNISDYAVFSLVGAAGGAFVLGHMKHNDHLSETGLLSGEAALNSTAVTYALKSITRRQRPFEGNGTGTFFNGGDSFPSEHATIAWSVASVLAHEYPGPLTQLASAVTLTRVTGKQHFSSDVLVGSVLGWYIGRQVYRAHHDPELGGAAWGEFIQSRPESPRNPANMGSPYVPLDSWVYPALERLTALGYVQRVYLGMRPWTRMECARLLEEAGGRLRYDSSEGQDKAQKIYSALMEEFSSETARLNGAANVGVSLDSIYTRFAGISGTPLRDGYHFGQTIINDYGRPYGEGLNNVTGVNAHAVAGPLSFYVRGEYQHAPSFPPLSDQARQVIQTVDGLPSAPPPIGVGATNRFNLVEGYVGLQLKDWQITFGKQALWWGADESGPMLFSANAAPITMLQITNVNGFQLPSILSRLGPIRFQYVLGRLEGQQWLFDGNTGFTGSWTQPVGNQPYITGQKLSFKPTGNLELGFSATTVLAGSGVPFTFHKLFQGLFSSGNGVPGTASDPGDRRGGFDFAYRIPKLRNWLTFYGDAYTEDQANPWFAWDKTAVTAGIYMPRIPKVPKMDLRVEGVFTDLPGGTAVVNHGFFYINGRYRSGYTNDGNLIGSWIGRQGQGAEAWTNYWFSAKNKVQLHFRHQTVSNNFIPGGGNLTDAGASADLWIHSLMSVTTGIQWERWNFPVIAPTPQTNITAQFQITFHPHWTLR